jgi:hypothetical protein
MTRDVPNWIEMAGLAAESKGYSELGKMLRAHAEHEMGHHMMMEQDTENLVNWWNERFDMHLSSAAIFSQGELPAVAAYRQLHLDLIEQAPFAQIAVEYEIERLSVEDGPKLFRKVISKLDLQVVKCLSFLSEHVAIDAGHTRLNKRALNRLIQEHPETLEGLVQYGSAALDVYASFLEACFQRARASVDEFALELAQSRSRPLWTVICEKFDTFKFLLNAFIHGRLGGTVHD